MTEKQPSALRLADLLDLAQEREDNTWTDGSSKHFGEASDELRRLHSVNGDMLAALQEIEQWTKRWANHDHPVASFARIAIAKATSA